MEPPGTTGEEPGSPDKEHGHGVTPKSEAVGSKSSIEAHEGLRAIFASAPVGIAFVDATGGITDASASFERCFGYEPGELQGTNVDRLIPGKHRAAHAAMRATFNEAPSVRMMGPQRRLEGARKDGSVFPVEVGLAPVGAHRGGSTAVTVVDISTRVELERQLQTAHAELRAVINAVPARISSWDAEGNNRFANRAFEELARKSAEEIRGRHVTDILGPEWVSAAKPHVEGAMLGLPQHVNVEVTDADGTHALAASYLPTVVDGRVTELVVYVADVTEQKRIERELVRLKDFAERASVAKSEFLANMSHEIRTPLNAMIGVGELLASSGLNEKQRSYISSFQTAADHLLHILNDILDLSKVEAGKLELERRPMSLRGVATQVVELMSMQRRSSDVEISLNVDPAVKEAVVGDAPRLRQVLLNLVGNAIKFTKAGEIELSVRPAGLPDHYEFRVRDTGAGIPEDRLDAIFEAFTQAESSTSRRFGGTGLGLSISKKLVDLMGGRLSATSKVGEGSTFAFVVALPESNERLESSGALRSDALGLKTPIPAPEEQSELDVLVVDDVAENRMLISAFLERYPWRLHFAHDGRSALERYQERRYDLVLMDVQMSSMDGLEATAHIRAREREQKRSPTPIVAMTAHAMPEEIARCRRAGANGHLAKPFSGSALVSAIVEFAERKVQAAGHDADSFREQLASLIPDYLEGCRRRLDSVQAALARGDLKQVLADAHVWKGTGTTYGLTPVSEIGERLEAAAHAGDHSAMSEACAALRDFLSR